MTTDTGDRGGTGAEVGRVCCLGARRPAWRDHANLGRFAAPGAGHDLKGGPEAPGATLFDTAHYLIRRLYRHRQEKTGPNGGRGRTATQLKHA
jgi:hypothetical protein